MKNLFKKKFLLDICFIFLLSLTPLLWFKEGTIIVGHDNVFALDPLTFLHGRLTTWVEHGFGQNQTLIMGTIPIHLIDAIPYMLGFSLQATQKIVYVFWFFMIGFSMYLFARAVNKESRIFQIVAVLLYQFNFFILQGWWIGERTKFSAYIAFPLSLLVFYKVYRSEYSLLKAVLLNSLIFFIFNAGGLYGIPLYGGFFITISVFVLFFSLLSIIRKQYVIVKNLLLLTILTIFGYLAVNSYFILPATSQIVEQYGKEVGQQGGIAGLISWASEISANTSIVNLLRLQGIAEWYDNREHPYARYFLNNPFLIGISFLWALLTFLSLLFVKKKEKVEIVLFLFIVYLIGILFAGGTHRPLGFIYSFLLETIPAFVIFRTPYFKFAPALFFATSILIAFTIDSLQGRFKKITFVILVLVVLIYHFPFFTVDFFTWRKGFSTRLEIPTYVYQFGQWLNNEKTDDARVAVLPPNSTALDYSKYTWGFLSYQSIATLLSNNSVVVNNDRVNSEEKELLLSFYQAISSKNELLTKQLALILRIKYIVLQEDAIADQDSIITGNAHIYKDILEGYFKFPVVKKIDKWTVYNISDDVYAKYFYVDGIDMLSGSVSDIVGYNNFSEGTNIVAKSSDTPSNLQIPHNTIYVPKCLNCPSRLKPFIRFPDSNILPDSPLYPLVLLNEDAKLHKDDTKSLIYDYLGISLKRAGELKEMLIIDKEVTEDFVGSYTKIFQEINRNFNKLESYENKLQVAEDLTLYMDAERTYLEDTIGIYVSGDYLIGVLGTIFQGMASVLTTTDPYVLKLDKTNNRIYEVTPDNRSNYFLYLDQEKLQSVLYDRSRVTVTIDDAARQDIILEATQSASKWLFFDKIRLTDGTKQIHLSFSELPNVLSELKEEINEFTLGRNTRCFVGGIKNFDPKKIYIIDVEYQNDFSNDLHFYLWEYKNNEKHLLNVSKLRAGVFIEKFDYLVKSPFDTQSVHMALCSRSLTEDILRSKINAKIHEVIYPSFLVLPEAKQQYNITPVTYRKLSPTKYVVSLPNSKRNGVLAFMERYDEGWTLSGQNKGHFRLNGYGNGWIIDKDSKGELIIEYKPQRVFQIGASISLFSVAGILTFFGLHLLRRKKTYESN